MQQNDSAVVLLTTAPDISSAKTIAQELLTRRLVACVNIIDGLTSMYLWKGKIEQEAESQLIMKTSKNHLKEIEVLLSKTHPYEVPELIALSIDCIGTEYSNWLSNNLKTLAENTND